MKISTDFIGSWVHGLASAFDVFTSCYYFGLLLVSVWDLLTSNIWWVFLWALLKIWKIWQITMHLTTFCHFSGSTASFRACPLSTFPPFLYLSYSEHSLTSLRSNFLKQIVCANYKSIFPILLHDLRLLFSIPTNYFAHRRALIMWPWKGSFSWTVPWCSLFWIEEGRKKGQR